jgi:ABC-type dipeptide/oligopeptide/nickel transport system permease component
MTMIVYVVVSIPLGVLSAVTRGRLPDVVVRLLSTAGLAVPAFWFGFLLQLVFYRDLGVVPAPVGRLAPELTPPPSATGFYLIDSLLAGDVTAFKSALTQLIPAGDDAGHLAHWSRREAHAHEYARRDWI